MYPTRMVASMQHLPHHFLNVLFEDGWMDGFKSYGYIILGKTSLGASTSNQVRKAY